LVNILSFGKECLDVMVYRFGRLAIVFGRGGGGIESGRTMLPGLSFRAGDFGRRMLKLLQGFGCHFLGLLRHHTGRLQLYCDFFFYSSSCGSQ